MLALFVVIGCVTGNFIYQIFAGHKWGKAIERS